MAWFVHLTLHDGGVIHIRPDMVKAVYEVRHGSWVGTNIVVDGHDFEVEGSPLDVMRAVQFDVQAEQP